MLDSKYDTVDRIHKNVSKVRQLLDNAMYELFTKMQSPDHWLLSLLPPCTDRCRTLRPRGHDYQLPNCSYNLHKLFCAANCLFSNF